MSSVEILASGGTPSVFAQMFGSGLIGLREGLETGIVVMVLVAFVTRSGRRDALKWIWTGVGIAVAMVFAVFAIIHFGTSTMTPLAAETIAGVASLVAVVIVTFMVLWMSKASAHISADLKEGMSEALVAGSLSILGLSFVAVGREGFETALLMVGYAESVSGGWWPLLGLLLGVLTAVVVTIALYQGAIRLNFHRFFLYTGAFLIVVAAGILAYAVHALQTVDWLPGRENIAFDISAQYDQSSWYGTIFAGIFNFRPEPTWLQVIAWLAYIAIVMPLFLYANLAKRPPAPAKAPASDQPADDQPATDDETTDAAVSPGANTSHPVTVHPATPDAGS
ncbi:iron uptake transporter permease EfeU [Gordonia sp. ABSL1-1]|uniref:iron uptake transporter permease EfeU n=1 Tax=Gordonia sp. ABSL1-1 TaxID=3053923 RepID=UPI0025738B8E|nr:iron uptake transporter permease EfeU [Gordonia sp. ABSL1-1]MDL9938477.1 iron uptake transporter permease EfeU [Gordonia sp. ABSL1-1]